MATSKEKIELKNLENTSKNNDINVETGSWRLKGGLAQMLKGGVIMDVINADEAKIVIAAINKNLHKKYRITKAVVEEAFPQIQWGNRGKK